MKNDIISGAAIASFMAVAGVLAAQATKIEQHLEGRIVGINTFSNCSAAVTGGCLTHYVRAIFENGRQIDIKTLAKEGELSITDLEDLTGLAQDLEQRPVLRATYYPSVLEYGVDRLTDGAMTFEADTLEIIR